MNWAMLYMILNPDIQTKVRKELDENIGRYKKAKMSDKSVTPYTEAVIHEIQRKGNIAPLAIFHLVQSGTKSIQIGEHELPTGTILIPFIGQIMHNPQHFPNPMTFDPNRYLSKENGKLIFKPHPHVIPFGIGKRRCLGEVLARMTIYKFLTAIIQKYEIVSGQDEAIIDKAGNGFTKSPISYRLIFKPREDGF